MSKAKKLFTNWRNILWIICLLALILAIHPNPDAEGVAIRSVLINSSAADAGIESPSPTSRPMNREVIKTLNSKIITDVESYNNALTTLIPNNEFTIKTDMNVYRALARPLYNITILGELENITTSETIIVNETVNGSTVEVEKIINKTIEVNKTKKDIIGVEEIGLKIYNAPKTNLKMGLDLQGGTRVLLQPEDEVSDSDMEALLRSMKQRLNIYGLSDVDVREASDLSGNTYIRVEIAGANEKEVKDLLAKQGKFEAKIGNETVFIGGKRDITYVCRSADCSGIDPTSGCGVLADNTHSCRFRFSISLSPDAAKRQGEVTSVLNIITTDEEGNPLGEGRRYLDKKLDLVLDDIIVDSLSIGADLRGSEGTEIAVSGGGVGENRQLAMFDALENMKKLQTYLSTGSLPVKIKVVKTDSISPVLGEQFIKNALFIGLIAMISVATTVFIRYRKLKIAIPIVVYATSEVVMLLGVAGIIGWNLDLAAIAGIIIVLGTSVDHQIVISDEILKKGSVTMLTMKQKIRNAFFIIMGSFFTTFVAMFPLVFAGAGLLKGFAVTTIIGLLIGVFISRPAFARTVEILIKE